MAITAQALEEYRLLAQAANKRLQRLEKLSQQKGYQGVKNWSYRTAMADIQGLRGAGKSRFPTMPKTIPTDPRQAAAMEVRMRRATKAAEAFMAAPSSTKSGIDTTYRKQAQSFSQGAGAQFNAKDLAGVFESGLWQALRTAGYGSETTRRIVGEIKKNADELKKLRERGRAMRFSDDSSPYSDRINDWLDGNKSAARVLGKYLSALNG